MSCEVLAVREQLERARDNLRHVEEGIKKTAVSSNHRFGEGARGGPGGRRGRIAGVQRFRFRADEEDQDEPPPKRMLSSVASRLGPMPKENKDTNKNPSDDEEPVLKSTVTLTQAQDRDNASSVINDTKTLNRSRRLFGSLLMGTLRQFKQEKEKTKTTETKQAEMWEKIEKKEAEQVALTTKDRQRLVAAKQEVNQEIKLLEEKMEIAEMKVRAGQEMDVYSTYIRTKTKPCIYYQPKEHNDRTLKSLKDSNHRVQKLYDERIEKYDQNIADIGTKLSQLNSLDTNLDGLNTVKVKPIVRTVSNDTNINPTTGIKVEVKLRDASDDDDDEEKPAKHKARGRQPKPDEKEKSVSPEKKRSRSPRNEAKSVKRSKSPRKRSASPKKRSKSPVKRSRSPRKRSASPKKRSKSPVKKSRSPRKRSASPKKRSKSPVKKSSSPRKRSASPKKRSKSPVKRSRSPRKRSASPKKRSKSPVEKSRSPRKRSASPKRRSRSRSPPKRQSRTRRQSPRKKSASPKTSARSKSKSSSSSDSD